MGQMSIDFDAVHYFLDNTPSRVEVSLKAAIRSIHVHASMYLRSHQPTFTQYTHSVMMQYHKAKKSFLDPVDKLQVPMKDMRV
jgi:hypothetical protein